MMDQGILSAFLSAPTPNNGQILVKTIVNGLYNTQEAKNYCERHDLIVSTKLILSFKIS